MDPVQTSYGMSRDSYPSKTRSRSSLCLAVLSSRFAWRLAKSRYKKTHCSCLVLGDMPPAYHPPRTEVQQRFSMGTVLTHPFLCLNRYKQNDRTTYIICYHSAPYSFTNKPEIGGRSGWRNLLLPVAFSWSLPRSIRLNGTAHRKQWQL